MSCCLEFGTDADSEPTSGCARRFCQFFSMTSVTVCFCRFADSRCPSSRSGLLRFLPLFALPSIGDMWGLNSICVYRGVYLRPTVTFPKAISNPQVSDPHPFPASRSRLRLPSTRSEFTPPVRQPADACVPNSLLGRSILPLDNLLFLTLQAHSINPCLCNFVRQARVQTSLPLP